MRRRGCYASARHEPEQPLAGPLTPDTEPEVEDGSLNLLGVVMVVIFIVFTVIAVFWLVQGSISTWLIQPEPP